MYTYAPYSCENDYEDEARYDNLREYRNPFYEEDDEEISVKFLSKGVELTSSGVLGNTSTTEYHHLPEENVFTEIESNVLAEDRTFEGLFSIHNQEDFDVFFERVYDYYYRGGCAPIIASVFSDFVISVVAGVISVIVLRCIDWIALLRCTDIDECHNMLTFIDFTWVLTPNQGFDYFMGVYIGLLSIYYLWIGALIPGKVSVARRMKILYEKLLKISVDDLPSICWEEVVVRLVDFQAEKGINLYLPEMSVRGQERVPVQENDSLMESMGVTTTADEIIRLRITRFQNIWKYLVINVFTTIHWEWYLPCSLRAFYSRHLRKKGEAPQGENDYRLEDDTPESEYMKICVKIPFTATMDTYLRQIIQNQIFTKDRTISKTFTAVNLRIAMITYGMILLLCLPFMCMYVSVFWILNIIEQSKNRQFVVGRPFWSYEARWKFYKCFELSHETDSRLSLGLHKWDEYSRMFYYPLGSVIRNSLGYIGGSVLAVLLVISILVDESVLLTTELWGRPLYWYILILTGGVVAIRGDNHSDTMNSSNIPIRRRGVSNDKLYDIRNVLAWGDDSIHPIYLREYLSRETISEPVRISWDILTMICLPFLLMFYYPLKTTDIVLEVQQKIRINDQYGSYCERDNENQCNV